MSQDVASHRSAWFVWTGTGFAVLMATGILAHALVPLASHASTKPSRLAPEVAFNPSMRVFSAGGTRLSRTGLSPAVLPVVQRPPTLRLDTPIENDPLAASIATRGGGAWLLPRRGTTVMLAKKAAVKKNVMVVLTDDIKNVGRKGEVVGVKAAYAQNFVIAQGLGKLATPDVLAKIEKDKADKAATKIAAKEAAEALKVKLDEVFSSNGAVIKKKVGPSGAIFGKVTSADLVQHIKDRTGVVVDRKLIKMPSFKGVGCRTAELALHKEVSYSMKLAVVADTSDGGGVSPEECFV